MTLDSSWLRVLESARMIEHDRAQKVGSLERGLLPIVKGGC